MRRPGYLFGCGCDGKKPGTLGEEFPSRSAMVFMRSNPAMPPELETGYIPEYMRYGNGIPYGLARHVLKFTDVGLLPAETLPVTPIPPTSPAYFTDSPLYYTSMPFVPGRDPRTFNVLMM